MEYYPPFAKVLTDVKMPERGTYQNGYPLGAICHYTAGRDGAEKTIRRAATNPNHKKRYTYWCIQKDGKIFCAHRVHKWGWHAGSGRWSKYLPFLKDSLNDDCIGIEINCAGLLTKKGDRFYTYWGDEVSPSNARYVDGKSKDQAKGYYEKYTPEQEETLVRTLLWLKANDPKNVFTFDAVLGHSEISGVLGVGTWRKVDPSGSLSCPMPELRRRLKELYAMKQSGASEDAVIAKWRSY